VHPQSFDCDPQRWQVNALR